MSDLQLEDRPAFEEAGAGAGAEVEASLNGNGHSNGHSAPEAGEAALEPSPKKQGLGGRFEHGPKGPMPPKYAQYFEIWFACGRNLKRAAEQAEISTMFMWRLCKRYDWKQLADDRDRAAQAIANRTAITRQAEMLEEHFQVGQGLIDRGAQYLSDHPIDSAKDAIAAIRLGVEIQRRNQGLPDWIAQIATASDADLIAQAQELMNELLRSRAETGGDSGGVGEAGQDAECLDVEYSTSDEPSGREGLLALPG